ncbi:MAG TPA: hypothetical protein VFV98_05060 [Vicinamibacterales bacterium]|nr:hypothetical protein [Vicinamibacterales bacterium]
MWRLSIILSLGVVLIAAAAAAEQELTQREADSMTAKLSVILERGSKPPAKNAPPLRTSFIEREVNAFFKFNGSSFLPTGVTNPLLGIEDGGRVRARAIADLDAVRTSQPRSWLDPAVYLLHGSLEVTAVGILTAANGKGTFLIENATLGGVSIPKSLLLTLVAHYTKTPEQPEGFNLDKPFDLPSNIRAVETKRGSATIVQ